MRKLASIQRIWKIEPIEGADKIELAFVLGWQCVVNKGQFKPMDLAVYFEIDSFLPIRDEFEFLRTSSYRKNDILGEGFRLKTMRFRGQISQGLLLPLGQFNELDTCDEIGTDDDLKALRYAVNSGVKLIATAHCSDFDELKKRPVVQKLIKEKCFDNAVILSGGAACGIVKAVYKL